MEHMHGYQHRRKVEPPFKTGGRKLRLTWGMKWTAIILAIAIIAVVLYLNIQRYRFLGTSVEQGNFGTASLLMAPELSAAVASIWGR